MDMNPVLFIGLTEFIGQHIVVNKVLRTFGTEFEHNSHRRIGVNIRIIAFEINIDRIRKENIPIGIHQMLLSRAALRVFLPIGDIFFRHVIEIVFHELLLNDILDFFHADIFAVLNIPFDLTGYLIDILVGHFIAAIYICTSDGIKNLFTIIGHRMARTFRNCF